MGYFYETEYLLVNDQFLAQLLRKRIIASNRDPYANLDNIAYQFGGIIVLALFGILWILIVIKLI